MHGVCAGRSFLVGGRNPKKNLKILIENEESGGGDFRGRSVEVGG